jgi:aminoglycoside phosphotransferase (APT) family kinase protein
MFKNEPKSDVIAVRPDERFDEGALADFLRGKLAGSDQALTVRQFGGGAANLTYLLDYGTHEYVLRRPPLGPVAKSAHDMGREYRVLSVLHRAFPYAPRAFLYHDDPALIGADFFVMERRRGVVVRREMVREYAGISHAPQKISQTLIDALAQLHAVDFNAIGLAELGKPDGFVSRQIEGWYKRWHKAKVEESPDFEWVYEWLQNHQPAGGGVSLVHNDYKLDNVMLASDDPSQMAAIFDWDMCTLGDPLCDLGALLCYWTEPNDPPYFKAMASMPVGNPHFLTRTQLVARYAAVSGRDVGDIHFYYALSLYRLSVIVAQIYIRYVRGQTKDKRFSAMGQVIPLIIQAARDVAEGKVRVD